MKKIVSIISALVMALTFTACNTAPDSADETESTCNTVPDSSGETESRIIVKRDMSKYKKFEDPLLDHFPMFLFRTVEDLEAASDFIVIGEFIDNSKHCNLVDDSGPKVEVTTYSSCPMKITKVLAGDVQVGDVVNVLQDEWYTDSGYFHTYSELTPMQMGDEWLFCLKHASDERYGDGYWCVGDTEGRYPTKNSASNAKYCFSVHPELGVYNTVYFNEELYKKFVEKYDI